MNRLKTGLLSLGKSLPRSIRKKLVNAAFHLDRDQFDLVSHRYLFAPDMHLGLEYVRSRGLNPRNIVDIGAFEGNWTKLARSVWPASTPIMVEANEQKYARLETVAAAAGGRLERALLGATPDQEVVFHVMESGSSVFEEHSPLERTQVRHKTTPLDALIKPDDHPDFIKIDVQGYEIEVLKGATETLRRAQAVLIELSLIEINEGAPLLHEVVSFMAERGFVAYDLLEIHRRPLDGAMNQVDVLFVPFESPLRADKRHYENA